MLKLETPPEQIDRILPVLEGLRACLHPLIADLPEDADSALTFDPLEGAE